MDNGYSIIEVRAKSLPEAWEKAVVACWENGDSFKTQYDKEEDPESKDCSAKIIVLDPMSEPRIHKAIPAGLEDLEIYRQEVLYGVHNHWISEDKWSYTYSNRLIDYNGVNQIEECIKKLCSQQFTRQAQAIIWRPEIDNNHDDCPCLQRLNFRIYNNRLRMDIDIRSNDAYKAGFMNMYAFTELQAWVCQELNSRMGWNLEVGRYIHNANSFHIYGSYFNDFEGFLNYCQNSSFESRVYNSQDVQYFFDSGKIKLFNNTQCPDISMPLSHLTRLYDEIPEDRKGELDKFQIDRINGRT